MVVVRNANRLPATVSPPSRGVEVAKGVAAVAGTTLVVIGVPVALLTVAGAPWPGSVPDRGWLASELTTDGLFKMLAVVLWLAWAHFVLCLVVEAVAERRARGLTPRVPGGGIGTQILARRLIGTIVLLAGSATMTVSSASAATTMASEHAPTHQVSTHLPAAPDSRAGEPYANVRQDASGSLPKTGDLDPATKDDVRQQVHGQVTYYDVKPPSNRNYDTLWDVAERYLGDGLRYKEIYQLNKGVTQPDGRVLRNADLIYPGWVLRMPADAKGPGLKVVDHAEPAPSGGAVSSPGETAGAGAQESMVDGASGAVTAEAGAAGESGTSAGTGGAGTGWADRDWAPLYGVAGGLLAAGVMLGLRRRRASLGPAALWAARTGPEGPDGGPPNPGDALRDESDLATACWIDRALRSWSSVTEPMPAPARCTVASSGLAVAFGTRPERPAPDGWLTSEDGRVWSLPRETEFGSHTGGPSPTPGLVAVGRRDDGSLLLLDLESIPGVVSIGGDSTVARAIAMSFAVDTATHLWADDREVTLVGFADDLTAVGQGDIRAVDDLERVLESLDNVAAFQRSACRRADTVSSRTARARQTDAGQWRYHLVVCSGVPSAGAVQRLSDLAADQQVSLAVVVVGDCPEAAARFAVGADGRLTAGFLGVDVVAQQLPVPTSRALAQMFDVPDARGTLSLDDVAAGLASEADLDRPLERDAAVHVELMGPVVVSAPDDPDPDKADLLTEIVSYLALHPYGAHANRIGAAIWPRGVSDETRDAALVQVQQWLGARTDGVSRLRSAAGVWHLDREDVAVDWDQFRRALNQAVDHPRNRESLLRGALSLVRGQAWEGAAGRYGWLANESVEDDMRMAAGLTAREVAESAAQRDDSAAARDALQRGLAMAPASEELWCAALRLAHRFAGPADTRVVADQMYAAIAGHGSPLGATAQTDALVEDLLPGYHTRAA